MSLRIFKYQLVFDDVVQVFMPTEAKPLWFAMQDGQPTLWVLVDDAAPKERRAFRIAGTGHALDSLAGNLHYIGSVQFQAGTPPKNLVFHCFDLGPMRDDGSLVWLDQVGVPDA